MKNTDPQEHADFDNRMEVKVVEKKIPEKEIEPLLEKKKELKITYGGQYIYE